MVYGRLIFTGGHGKCVNKISRAAGIKLLTDADNHRDQVFLRIAKIKLRVNA